MKLRNILIAAATMGVMFASADRTGVVGYTAGDYDDMNTYPHNASGQNVAFTSGDSFEAVWTDGGTTWGFAGGDTDELVNMLWANGTFGVSVGLSMDSGTAAGEGVEEVSGETTMDLGFGMNLAGWDVGFGMGTADGAPMMLNARGNLGFWAFDTMTFGYHSGDDYTTIDVNMYGLKEWGAATGMFAMGFTSTDNQSGWGTDDAVSLLNTGFSVESTLTDWCDLRIGYNKSFNVGAETGGVESQDHFAAGVGFNLGSVQLDMTLSDGTLNSMMSNPLNYISGYNSDALTTSWTLSYNW
tara:strand:+ start:4058 stop:4951 length:894 start_codon:yes stop_codon:yes gene_type:complete